MSQFAIAPAWHYWVDPWYRKDFISHITCESLCITQKEMEEADGEDNICWMQGNPSHASHVI